MAAAEAPELRDRGDRSRVICLALPQFPDAHKYQGVLPVFGRSCKGSSEQFVVAAGALEIGDAVI